MSKNVICTNLIVMLLHKSGNKCPHRKYEQTVYLLYYISYIFPGTIKKRTSSGMNFHCMSNLREEVFSEESSLPCSRQDNESSGYGAPLGSSSPGKHELLWFPGTTLLAEGGPLPVRGGRLRAATAAAMIAAAACDPAGSVLFEY